MKKIYGLHLRTEHVPVFATGQDIKKYDLGQWVLVETDKGDEIGKIYHIGTKPGVKALLKIKRSIQTDDIEQIKKIKKMEKHYFEDSSKKINKYKLNMKIIAASLSFNLQHLTLYFTSEGRVDFRELLKDLVASYHKLIRLQQIGPRDEAKIIGGFGPCGQPICCKRFIAELPSITMEDARLQNLDTITSNKISGLCGKLMCCLSYEEHLYKDMKKNLPQIGEKFQTKSGEGKVVSLNVIQQKILVELDQGGLVEISISYK